MSCTDGPDVTCDEHSPEDACADSNDSMEGDGGDDGVETSFVVIVFIYIASQSICVQGNLMLVVVQWGRTRLYVKRMKRPKGCQSVVLAMR